MVRIFLFLLCVMLLSHRSGYGENKIYCSSPEGVHRDTVYQSRTLDFTGNDQDYPVGSYINDFGNNKNNRNIATVNASEAGRMSISNNTLCVKLLANKIGDAGGMWADVTIGRSTTTKVLQYDVKFGNDSVPFEWSMGGKIPGLGGGQSYAGCSDASAGDGWTARVMWRSDNSGNAYFIPYIYYVDKPSRCGDDFGLKYYGSDSKGLKSNRWYRVRIEIVMNTGTAYNGQLKITIQENMKGQWQKAVALIDKSGIRYATRPEGLETGQILVSIFRGGSTMQWAANTDGYIYFDNLSWSDR